MRPLALPVLPSNQRDFNRRVAEAVNLLRVGVVPVGSAIAYQGATPPEGYALVSPAPVALASGWIWITPEG